MKLNRRLSFDLHSWIGLKLCIFMGFICLTGTLAVLAHEIDWLVNPAMRVTPGAQRATWGEQLDAAQRAYPDWQLLRLDKGEGSRFATRFNAKTAHGRLRYVWVDPYSGQVTGDSGWFNVQRFLRNTHRHLMMPVKFGVPIVASLAIALLLSLITSLYIYKKWWAGWWRWPRPERSRRFWGDLHRLAGVWSLWFVLLIGLTGLWYLIESLGGRADALQWTRVGKSQAAPVNINGTALDRALALAQADWPRLEIHGISMDEKRGIITLEGQADAMLVRDRANALRYHADGVLLQRIAGTQLSVHQRISEMADPLHFGNFAGLPIKLVWFFFGALLTTLSLSGAYLYGLRIAASLRGHQAHTTGERRKAAMPIATANAWVSSWQGMHYWRWLCLLLLAVCFLLIPEEVAK